MQSDSSDPQESQESQESRGTLFEDYLSCHVTLCPEPGPCRDEALLSRAAQVLLQNPGPDPHHVMRKTLSTDPSHLPRLSRATELLETLCLNLYLQPWRKDIRKLKTFTGAFVYCLLPALGSTTLQSILASVGYFPHELSPSEYRLCEDARPEGALQVAFQLLLNRALCGHLLQLQQHSGLAAQVCVEKLQLKLPPAEAPEGGGVASISTDTDGTDLCSEHPKASGLTEDQSIYHLHLTYPDLVLRGRPLLQEDGDTTLSQHAPLYPHRRHMHRIQAPPTNQDEGLSGPSGLSLHITLRPQIIGPSTNGSHLHNRTDMSGFCEEHVKSPVTCEDGVPSTGGDGEDPNPLDGRRR
ncbi:hypothetical protein NQD34_011528 [Periophthalmus magnuspinnatus]|nr:hypothetical protein NQD34_011528 [Periophthalmus magnuspinnatus]